MNTDKEGLERYLSTGELITMRGISRSTIYRLLAKGMPNIMIGSVHRFPVNQIVAWLEKQPGNKLANKEMSGAEI